MLRIQSPNRMNLSEKNVHRIRRHRKQPEYGKLLKTLSDQFRIVLFTQEIYEVGRGGFGRCCLGKFYDQQHQKPQQQHKEDQKQNSFQSLVQNQKVVVVKIIPKNKSAPNDELYIREVDNLASVCRDKNDQECKNIVKIYPFKIISDNNYYLVMEYCYHSTLADLIQTRKRTGRKFNLGQLLAIIQDLLNGYGLLRSKKIIHNDLKPHNIFIKDKIFKIGDFGISVKLNENEKNFIPINCTFPYSPIEKLQKKAINHKADIYALGLIFAEIIFGKHPYFDQRQWKQFYSLKLEQLRIEKENQNIIELGIDQCPDTPEGIIEMNRRKNQKKRNIFIQYLKEKTMHTISLPIRMQYEPEDAQLVKEIKQIVLMMCGREDYRPTFQNVRVLLANLNNIKLTTLKYPKFEDLKYLRSSELNYDVNNMPKSSYSLVSNMSLRESTKRQNFNLLTFQKLLSLKSRLSETTNFVNLLYLIASNLNTSQKCDTVDVQLLKLQIYHYLYWVSQNELQAVTDSIAKLNEQELAQLYSLNMYKMMRNCQLDNDKLSELVFVETKGNHLAAARQKLTFWLQNKYLNNITISQENYEEYYLFFIISDLIKCESKYTSKEDKRPMAEEMETICSLLAELEKDIFPYQFFLQREKEYVIFYK